MAVGQDEVKNIQGREEEIKLSLVDGMILHVKNLKHTTEAANLIKQFNKIAGNKITVKLVASIHQQFTAQKGNKETSSILSKIRYIAIN